MHLGHAFSALTAFDAAQAAGGRFLLRIEDIDAPRCRPEYEAAIYEDLAWLSLRWEQPARRQSEHLADYEAALERLRGEGLLYRCFRTRRELVDIQSAPHGPRPAFRGGPLPPVEEAERLARGDAFAWRLSLDAARCRLGGAWDDLSYVDSQAGVLPVRPETVGDVVLARKEIGVAYHLASVVDDAVQGVTQVIRGEDLREAIHIHRLLQALLDFAAPSYRHHALLLGDDGRRLAKRDGAPALADLRAQGVTAAEVRARVFQAG